MGPAALPWYSFPSTRPMLDCIWRAVSSELREAGIEDCPRRLDHSTSYQEFFAYPSLLLSQCCGPELFLARANNVLPIAVPVISAYEVAPGEYFSYIVASKGANLKQPRVAVNSYSSYSGYSAIKLWLATNNVADYVTYETGSHQQSVGELHEGRADIAAIDALSWQFLGTDKLQVVDQTESVPAPPFIVGSESRVPNELLVAALNTGLQNHGEQLGISGALPAERADYEHLL